MKTSLLKCIGLAALAALAVAVNFIPDVAVAAQHVAAFVGPTNLASIGLIGSVAATITKDDAYTGKNPMNTQPQGGGVKLVPIPFTYPTAAPVANDTHALCTLMPGVQVIDYDFYSDDVDSNGTPTASVALGELAANLADIAVTYQSVITVEQTGGLVRFAAATQAADLRTIGAATLNTSRTIGLKWNTAAATYTPGGKGLLVLKVVG